MENPYDEGFNLFDELFCWFGKTEHEKWLEFEMMKANLEYLNEKTKSIY